MAYKDNRKFIDDLIKTGDAVKVKQEVDWELEAGAIIRHTSEVKGPAPLFEKIKDYSTSYRLAGALMATYRRAALAMSARLCLMSPSRNCPVTETRDRPPK